MSITTPATEGAPEATEFAGKVRPNGRETSWIAASAQTNTKTAALQIRIYEHLLRLGPATDEELLIALGGSGSPSGIRTRRHELELAGWVTPETVGSLPGGALVSLKRPGLSGFPQTVWRAIRDDEPAPYIAPKRPNRKHSTGLAAAKRFARWEYGNAEMAAAVIHAYLNPAATHERLDTDGAPAWPTAN